MKKITPFQIIAAVIGGGIALSAAGDNQFYQIATWEFVSMAGLLAFLLLRDLTGL